MTSVFIWIQKFIAKFGFKDTPFTYEKLDFTINTLITEEYNELLAALKEKNSEETIDALGDTAWLCIKLMYELDVDPSKVFQEIGRANLAKKRGIKPGRENSNGFDVVKPPEWKGPVHKKNHGVLDDIYDSAVS